MKQNFLTAFLAFAILYPSFLHAQGSLTPPGPPGPTMVTLSQIEPRTPINTLPSDSQDLYVISRPGSYYLTANITVASGNAISINTNGVTLDLNGFTISSTGSGGTAILLFGNEFAGTGNSDITIFNGHITGGVTYNDETYSGPGFNNGINYFEQRPYNVRVTGVSVSGCSGSGIYLGTENSTVVESCTVNTVGSYGIEASSVSHSTANQCGNTAISADTASDCYGYSTGGDGLDASFAANNCYGAGSSTSGDGIYVTEGNANNCTGNSSSDNGVGLSAYTANNCYGYNQNNSSSGTGLFATSTANNCYGYNYGSGTGLSASIAIGCTCYSVSGVGLDAYIANSCFVISGTTSVSYPYNMP